MKLAASILIGVGCFGLILCSILGGAAGMMLGLIVGWLTLPYVAFLLIPREEKL